MHKHPPRLIVDHVATGALDVAIAWGPLAGYFAARESVPLSVRPVPSRSDDPILPMSFEISMGFRKKDAALASRAERRADGAARGNRKREAIEEVLRATTCLRGEPRLLGRAWARPKSRLHHCCGGGVSCCGGVVASGEVVSSLGGGVV